MNGVTFTNKSISIHSYDDWGLLLSSYDVEMPSPKTEYVDITGGDGTLDLTETYGRVFYNDRTITINLTALDDELRWTDKLDTIIATLHGKTFKIAFDNNNQWYYNGRIEVNKYSTSKRLGKIVLKATCEPYKLKQLITTVKRTVNSSLSFDCVNARMETIPTFKVTAPMTMIFKGNSYALKDEVKFNDLIFTEGDNLLQINGTGDIEIKYQEGTL